MKTKKKKSTVVKKKASTAPIEQRRYDNEVVRRKMIAEKIAERAENYNTHQERRNKELALWMGICFSQRERLQEVISQELARQQESVEKFPELKKLGVKVPLPKLVQIEALEFDPKAAVAPLLLKASANGKAAKPAKKGKAKPGKKIKRKAKPAPVAAEAGEGEE